MKSYHNSHSWFVHLYHALFASVRCGRPRYRVFDRVPWHSAPIMDRRRVLLRHSVGSHHLLDARLRVEIVSRQPSVVMAWTEALV